MEELPIDPIAVRPRKRSSWEYAVAREDREHRRWEYVLDQIIANAIGGAGVVIGLLAVLAGVALALFSGVDLEALIENFVVFGLIGCLIVWHSVRGIYKARQVPYVPPVRRQTADLPADEILLRGVEEPSATTDELLRAAHTGTTAPSNELLRCTVSRPETYSGEEPGGQQVEI